jgi:outer membrane protein assembly factor BamB
MMLRSVQDHRALGPWLHPSRLALVLALSAALASAARPLAKDGDRQRWRMIGHDPRNSRNQPREHRIRPANVNRLALKWVATTAGDVSATPAVVDSAVYFGDFGGMLWKLDAETGQVIWSHPVSDYTGIAGDIARTSPSIVGNTLVVGDLRRADTGRILWRTYSLPDNGGLPGGYAGATMFAPPSVDRRAGLVYGTFGQPYTEPASVTACHAANGGSPNRASSQGRT